MRINTVNGILAWSLLAVLCVGFSPLQASDEPAGVKVIVERVARMSRNEVRISLKVANTSGRPVFLSGINFETPIPDPIFLDQWRTKEGWKTVAPCMDTPPPHVIKINSSGAITLNFVLTVPPARICKDQSLDLEGKFQYRLYYFNSENQAQTYLKKLRSGGNYQPAHAAVAVSEPFEIPVASEQPSKEH